MAIELISTQVDYNPNKPIKETIKATGRFAVTSASVLCEGAELTRDILILARETLKESVIEARIDARRAEIAGLTELHTLELEYAATLAKLQGDTNA